LGGHDAAAAGPGPQSAGAAEFFGAFPHRGEADAGPVGRADAAPVVGDFDTQYALGGGQCDGGGAGPCVPGDVGDRFGGDPVGGDLDRGGQGGQGGAGVDADL